ncbi:hypothetical protein QUF72_00645 [Desulfobacterales bacterium HSG2]|nr:hypothetical protein [Desulfobacterales bacterium HSG2]MDM8548544.1 hypothetical protein [Desulfobacterales bacterium HSG2]
MKFIQHVIEKAGESPMKFIQHVIEKIDDNLNPIMVKELRQAVRSRFVAGILMICLLTLLTAMLAFIGETALDKGGSLGMGRRAFSFLFPVFMVPSMIFVPVYTGTRLFRERTRENMDLIFISTIGPAAIIRGNLFAGIIIELLIFSTFLPFMTLTYLLRGVDLPSVFVIMAMAFIAITIATQFALFVASVSSSQVFVLSVAMTGPVIGFCMFIMQTGYEVLRSGVRSSDFWCPLIMAGLFSLAIHDWSVTAMRHSSGLCLDPQIPTNFQAITRLIGITVAIPMLMVFLCVALMALIWLFKL